MKPPSKKSGLAASPSASDEAREGLVKEFRAYLHLVMTAQQIGGNKQLETVPGPGMAAYCRALAALPDNALAVELANAVVGILRQISDLAAGCEGSLRSKDPKAVAFQDQAKRVLGQIDFALAVILRNLTSLVRFRAAATQDLDLACEWTHAMVTGGPEAEQLARRYHQLFPEQPEADGSASPDSFAEFFAWDVYQRVAALDRLADEFPDHIRLAAQRMHAWPMLAHRHTNNRRRFQQLATKLELGAEYPLDATEGARFRPDTPWVRYLDPLIHRLHVLCCELAGDEFETPEKERDMVDRFWWQWPEEPPGEEVVRILCRARRLQPLNKATASQWAKKVVVPMILATDARDWQNCAAPVLQRIARQRGVKSRATFNSRLLAPVSATLRRLARPA